MRQIIEKNIKDLIPYCNIAIIHARWQDFTGKQAALESNGKTYNELLNDNQAKNTH